MFTKLFRKDHAMMARLIFMAGAEKPAEAQATPESAPKSATEKLTQISQDKITEITKKIGTKDSQKIIDLAKALEETEDVIDAQNLSKPEADKALQKAVDAYFSENDLNLSDTEKTDLIDTLTFLQKQVSAKLSERTRELSRIAPWTNLTVEGKTIPSKDAWQNLSNGTEIKIQLKDPDEIKYTGLYELLPPTVTKIEVNGKKYERKLAVPGGLRGGYYRDGKQTRANYLAVTAEALTLTIAETGGTKTAAPTADVGPIETTQEYHARTIQEAKTRAEEAERTTAAAESAEEAGILSQMDTYVGTGVTVPNFLRKGLPSATRWQQLLEAGEQAGPGNRRVVELVQAEPFKWTLRQFRDVMNTGANKTLSFNDIIKNTKGLAELGIKNEKNLEPVYKGLTGERDALTKKISEAQGVLTLEDEQKLRATNAKIAQINAAVVGAARLMYAFEGLVAGEKPTEEKIAYEGQTPEEQFAESAFTDLKEDKAAEHYSMDDMARGAVLARYGRTDFLSRRMSGESAYEEFMQEYGVRGFDANGEKTVDQAKMTTEFQRLMELGMDNVFMDPQIDVVKTAKKLGIPDTTFNKNEKDSYYKAQKVMQKWAKKIDKGGTPEEMTEWNKNLRQAQEIYRGATEVFIKIIKAGIGKIDPKTPLTETQKMFIRLGFGVDGVQREIKQYAEACHGAIELAQNDQTKKILYKILEADAEKRTLTPQDYTAMGQKLDAALQKGFEMKQGNTDEGEEALKTTRSNLTAGGGAGYSMETQGWGAGGGLNVDLGKGFSIHIAGGLNNIGGEGGLIPGVGGGASYEAKLGERVSLVATLDVSTAGTVAALSLPIDLGKDWSVTPTAGGGLLWNVVPVGFQSVKVGHGAEGEVTQSKDRAEIAGGVADVEQALQQHDSLKATAAIRKIPQFENLVTQVDNDPSLQNSDVKAAVLVALYQMYKAEIDIKGTKDAKVSPFGGVVIGVIEIGGVLPIPMAGIEINVKGSTLIIPVVDRNLPELKNISDAQIQEKIRQKLGKPIGEVVDGAVTLESTVVQTPNGKLINVTPSQKGEIVQNAAKIAQNLADFNREAAHIGVQLEERGASLYKMNFSSVNNAFVEVHIDPKTQGKMGLRYGEGSDIFLSLNETNQNLIITREEFILPYNKEGKNKIVMFTIKENPYRTRTQIQKEETGYLEYSRDIRGKKGAFLTPVQERRKGEGARQNNIRSAQEDNDYYETHRDAAEFAGEKYEKNLNDAYSATIDAFGVGPDTKGEISDAEITAKVDAYLKKNPIAARQLSTRAYNLPNLIMNTGKVHEDYAALLKKIFGDQKLNSVQATVALNHLIVETFQQTKGNDQFKADLKRFFEPMLKSIFAESSVVKEGKESADTLTRLFLEQLRLETLDIKDKKHTGEKVPAGMEVYTVVGTKKITGLREMSNFTGDNRYEVLNMIDLTKAQPALRSAVLEMVSPIPAEDKAFLESPLGLELGFNAPILLGTKEAKLLASAKEKTGGLTEAEKAAVKTLRILAEKVRAAEERQISDIALVNSDGITFSLRIHVALKAGIYQRCGNPMFMGKETFTIVKEGQTMALQETSAIRANPTAQADIIHFMLGFAIQPKKPSEVPPGRTPPGRVPPGQPEKPTDGIGADEGPEAGIVGSVRPNTNVNLEDNNEAPGQGG